MSIFKQIRNYFKEQSQTMQWLQGSYDIVFYSEKDIYYQYFEGLIEGILKTTDYTIQYLTSDENDSIFHNTNPRIKPLYVNTTLAFVFSQMKANKVFMTMPDLQSFHIKRSKQVKEYIYVFHAFVSTHQQYRKAAFDHFDTILCVGPHHIQEIRATEAFYGLPPKKLIESGYHLIEKIYLEHQKFKSTKATALSNSTILLAPSWGHGCILETCIFELIDALKGNNYKIVIRPHPEFLKRMPEKVKAIQKQIQGFDSIQLELNMMQQTTIHEADILITDRSGIAYEYAFGTERPVIFIDTPPKINNTDFNKINIMPIENSLRNMIGISLLPNEINQINQKINLLLKSRVHWINQLPMLRDIHLFNWLNSASCTFKKLDLLHVDNQ